MEYSLRTLKGMRQYHRKHRANPLHHERFREINRTIKIKQDTYYFEQGKAFQARLERFLKHG